MAIPKDKSLYNKTKKSVYKKYPNRNRKKEGTAVSRMINFFPGFRTRLISRNP